MRFAVVWVQIGILFAVSWPGYVRATRCDRVQAAIDSMVAKSTPPPVLLRLGPHFSPRALDGLLALGQNGPLKRRLAAYGAFGLSRHADGLRRLTAAVPPPDPEGRLAYSLATLALGADSGTATVAATVESATVAQRRGAIWVLSRMRHVRPRQMLYSGLSDKDPEVRLTAAEALVRYGSRRARVVLTRIVSKGSPDQRRRAVEALMATGHRFRPAELRRLNPDLAARAFAPRSGPANVSFSTQNPASSAGFRSSGRCSRRGGGAERCRSALADPTYPPMGQALRSRRRRRTDHDRGAAR